jgi:asparagine synthase (glutamine-hydrolysing)
MCGFAGLLSTAGFTGDELADYASRMIAPIAHRGPDDSGVWVDAQAGIALGFRRLAILDRSPLGHQPMQSPSGRYVAVFNGEIYNFVHLRRGLEQRGHRFRGRSDTEVMLAAFDEWGIRLAVERFVGMFAIAAWDSQRRELTFVRDRLGKKPLYVYRDAGLITFGSELKALVAAPRFDRSIDLTALASYLRYLYVPSPKTIFQRAAKLRPAHILTVSNPNRSLPPAECYWSLEDVARRGLANPIAGEEAETIDQLETLLREAVQCRLHSDVPIGALLSGGVDSATVVALMQEASSRPVKTYTIGFAEAEFDEARHAACVARHLGTDHVELLLTGEDAYSLVPQLPQIFDEPFADPSQLPALLVSQLARGEVAVALCGDGGDELFGGYNRYIYGARILARAGRIPHVIRQCLCAGIDRVPPSAWDRVQRFSAALVAGVPREHFGQRVHKVGRLLGAASTGEMYRSLLSAWQQPEDLLVADALDAPAGDDENRRILDGSDPACLLDRMMLADQLTYLPDDLLAKVDRTSMAVSLEVRAPLLDHRLVELSWRLPRSLKVRGSLGKWALRQVLYPRVPRNLVERPKMGFSVPIDRWLRGPLRHWAEHLLSGSALHGSRLLNEAAIARAWRELQDDRRPVGAALWAILMFQAWRAQWQT